MNAKKLSERIGILIEKSESVLSTRCQDLDFKDTVDSSSFAGMRTSSLSFIERLYGKQHSYYVEFSEATNHGGWYDDAERAHAILLSIREEIDGDWIFEIRDLVSAELFSDFISMSEHLISEGYKDPAAVLVGSVLEEHLRQLCGKNSIGVEIDHIGKTRTKKAETMNSELAKAGVYTLLDQKSVTAWLDLRNKAAHGNYSEYSEDQVKLMKNGVVDFIARSAR